MIQNPKPHRGLQIAVAVGAAAALNLAHAFAR